MVKMVILRAFDIKMSRVAFAVISSVLCAFVSLAVLEISTLIWLYVELYNYIRKHINSCRCGNPYQESAEPPSSSHYHLCLSHRATNIVWWHRWETNHECSFLFSRNSQTRLELYSNAPFSLSPGKSSWDVLPPWRFFKFNLGGSA